VAPLVIPVDLGPHARAAVTGRDRHGPTPPVGAAGNLSHRRPHRPDDLARARAAVGEATSMPPARWHLLRQVHGARVAEVGPGTPVGAELRDVDAAVTAEPDRVLAVQSADCVPVLLAGPTAIGVAHAGRAGVTLGVVPSVVAALEGLHSPPDTLRAVLGPAIGGCCYEVPEAMHREVVAGLPEADATTTWGTPALDLPAAVTAQLTASGVTAVDRVGGCTRCDPGARWFSHRADAGAGRQLGLVVRVPAVAA
jgi:YfiH family protein